MTGVPLDDIDGLLQRAFARKIREQFFVAQSLHGDKISGLLTGKKALIFNTTGLPSTFYTSQGLHEAMSLATDTGIFELCGMEVLHHAFFGSVHSVSAEARESYLGEVVAITSRYL